MTDTSQPRFPRVSEDFRQFLSAILLAFPLPPSFAPLPHRGASRVVSCSSSLSRLPPVLYLPLSLSLVLPPVIIPSSIVVLFFLADVVVRATYSPFTVSFFFAVPRAVTDAETVTIRGEVMHEIRESPRLCPECQEHAT